ncbi:hypothetical protein PG993_008855 [Apiospora rasikravindrae]|uniref:GPI inositol-deacylase winged helix domain-containing protein n=1 Tax=Apiospora rasikravindrae TaxID=990691 RepID=A0ABR1SPI1_9PEZI
MSDFGASIFVTSRFIPEIETRFEDAVQVEIRASESDISRYPDSQILYIEGYVSRNQERHEEIKQKALDCVDGMFLLAQLHLDPLRGKSRVKDVRTALGNLAKGSNAYDEAYKNAMARINGQVQDQRELAMQTLSWIVCAKRPLKPEELRHALGVEFGESDMNSDDLPDLQNVLSSCCGLVAIDEESDAVGLVHQTTRQYFERTQETWAARKGDDAIPQLLLGEDEERDTEGDDGSKFRDLSGIEKMETCMAMFAPEKSDELRAARTGLAAKARKSCIAA